MKRKGCAFCGHEDVGLAAAVDREGVNGVVLVGVECATCGARGQLELSEPAAERSWDCRNREATHLLAGLLIGFLGTLIWTGIAHKHLRERTALELQEAWALTERVERQAFDRGVYAARALARVAYVE